MVEGEKQEIKTEDDQEIDDFDMESLIVEGTDAIIERIINYHNIEKGEDRKMRVYVRPQSKLESAKAKMTINKDKKQSLEVIVCKKCWLEKNGMPVSESKIQKAGSGVVDQVYKEIQKISGEDPDGFETKFFKAMSNF